MKLSKVVFVEKDNCVNCHKCISVCPVKFCNDGSGDYVKINESLCIGCGECIKGCEHQARQLVDDFTPFMDALKRQEKIVAVIAPAIAAEYPNKYKHFNGWLKSIGVSALFDVSFGAELTIKSYLEHVKENKPKAVIAQPCPAIVSFIEIYHPELIKYLAPADSPMMHTIKLIKNYYPQYSNYKIVIVSPCIAKKREFEAVGLGDYNVTMKKFTEYIKTKHIDLTRFPEIDFDNDPAERAVLFSTPGGLLRTAQREYPEIINVARKIEEPATIYHYLSHLEKDIKKEIAPLLIDCLNCEQGCNGGTGTSKDKSQDEVESLIEKRNIEMQNKYKSKSFLKSSSIAHKKIQKVVNNHWKKNTYDRKYSDLSISNLAAAIKVPTGKQRDNIFMELLKEEERDFLNCGACGYNNCEEMALAIHNGINKKENCFHYEKKYFTKSVNEMMSKMEKFSEGDLTVQLNCDKDDEIGKFYSGFSKALENIRRLLYSLITVINSTANTGEQISASSEEMAVGALEQSNQTTEVASAVEEMTKTIFETTKNSSSAVEAAKKAGLIAKEGGKVISDTIEGMNKIADVVKKSAETVIGLGESSNKIGDIIQVINDIADQTNLLALNAAIEAARAGEQGRGFAVVADEVRKLAERTSKATKEIAVMIKNIQKNTEDAVDSMKLGTSEVEKGKNLTDKAGQSLKQIIVGAEEVIDMVTQVAAASEEQASTAEQISKSIERINNVTRENSEGINQIAKASENLNQLTVDLKDLVANFKVDGFNSGQRAVHAKNIIANN